MIIDKTVWWVEDGGWKWLLAWYLLMSVMTFAAYAVDKSAAVRGKWRIRESTLHTFELLGGWPGALLAQKLLRHKSCKLSFRIVFFLIVAVHLAGLGYIAYRMFG